jgi:hypothetical protein
MWDKDEYFKGISFVKIAFLILFFFGAMFMVGQVRAEDNKTINNPTNGFPKILDDDRWSSQLVYDTLGACYQGTIKWIIMTNPSLLGQMPGPMAQRQMMEHCFCVLDKVRKNQPLKEYIRRVFDQIYIGDLFMKKALECIGEYKTLPSFFMKIPTPDNETKSDNNTIIKPDKPKDSQDEPPGQNPKESNDLPDTLFQG